MSEEFLGIPDLEVIADPASQGLSSLNVGQEFGQPLIPVPQFERPEDFRDFVSQNRLFGGPEFGPNDTRLEQRGDQSVLVDSVTGEPILDRFSNFAIPNDVLLEQSRILRDNPEFGQGRTPIIDPVTGEPVGLVPFAPIISPDLFNEDSFESQVNTALANQEFQEVPKTRSEIEAGLRALQQGAASINQFRPQPIPAGELQRQVTQQPSDVIFGGEDTSDFLIGGGGSDFGRTPTIGLSSDFDAINRRIQRSIRGERPPQPQEIIREEAPREEAPTPSLLQQLMKQFFRNIFPTGQKKDEQAGLPSLLDRLANFNVISSAMAGELPGRTPIPLRAGVFSDADVILGNPPLTPREQRKRAGAQATEEIRQAVGPEIYDARQRQRRNDPALQAARERFFRENRYQKKKGGQVLKGRAMRRTNYNHQKFI